jgi:hypothetical protein
MGGHAAYRAQAQVRRLYRQGNRKAGRLRNQFSAENLRARPGAMRLLWLPTTARRDRTHPDPQRVGCGTSSARKICGLVPIADKDALVEDDVVRARNRIVDQDAGSDVPPLGQRVGHGRGAPGFEMGWGRDAGEESEAENARSGPDTPSRW